MLRHGLRDVYKYTVRKFNCLALCDEIFEFFTLLEETLRHVKLCNMVFSHICAACLTWVVVTGVTAPWPGRVMVSRTRRDQRCTASPSSCTQTTKKFTYSPPRPTCTQTTTKLLTAHLGLALFFLFLYSIHRAICHPSDCSVGRRRAEIRTRDGPSKSNKDHCIATGPSAPLTGNNTTHKCYKY